MAVNTNPSQDANCESLYYPLQNANFNVIGLTDATGMLVERYDYTPYGERTVYKKAGSSDVLTTAPLYHSQPVLADGQPAPYGLCDFGHQGLQHDKEFGWWYNRFRYGDPIGRWPQRDPFEYADAISLYLYNLASPADRVDWPGGSSEPTTAPAQVGTRPDFNLAKAAFFRDYNREPSSFSDTSVVLAILNDMSAVWNANNKALLEWEKAQQELKGRRIAEHNANLKVLSESDCGVAVLWGDEVDFDNSKTAGALRTWNLKHDKAGDTHCAAGGLACYLDGRNIGFRGGKYAIPNFPSCDGGTIGRTPGAYNGGENPPEAEFPRRRNESREAWERRRSATGFAALLAGAWRAAVEQGADLARDCRCRCKDNTVTVYLIVTPSRQNDGGQADYEKRLTLANSKWERATATVETGDPEHPTKTYPRYPKTSGDESKVVFDCVKGRVGKAK